MEYQNTLKQIGDQLDHDIYPYVINGGIVMPCETNVSVPPMGEESSNERKRSRRSKTRPRNGPTGRQGASNQTPSLICTDFQTQYESEVSAVIDAYSKTQVWQQPEGLLLLTESLLLTNNNQPATFLIMVPYAEKEVVKGWGFWVGPISAEWIGPRHTNFPDGTICAFEPKDGTWVKGDSLVTLIDLYSLWALRHIHMREFGRWPGKQAVHHPYERILELRKNEYCGCEHSEKLYSECCHDKDLKRNIVADAINFSIKCHRGERKPPEMVKTYIFTQTTPPKIKDLTC